ncbi:MAG: CPBP family intramembrane metalloprotease [Chlorobiota bacterium]|nr:MAG: CPBP family intramembrane metalloprotease [Chlorobiota bacterium]
MENFISNSKYQKNKAGWYLLGTITYLIFSGVIMALPLYFIMNYYEVSSFSLNKPLIESLNLLIGIVFSFLGGIIGLKLMFKYIHKSTLQNIISTSNKIRINRIVWGFVILFSFNIMTDIINYLFNPDDYQFLGLSSFRVIMFFAFLILIPIQAGAEELLCRGYLMQGIFRTTKSVWTSIILQSLIFALLHSANPEVLKFNPIYIYLSYISTGIFFGLLTIFDNGIELAIGMHAASNIYSLSIINYKNSAIPTNSFFNAIEINPQYSFYLGILSYVLILVICYYLFKWEEIRKNLSKIEIEENLIPLD